MELNELRKKKISDLRKLASEIEEKLASVTLAIKTAEETDISKKKKMKKQLARILTVIKEKEIISSLKEKK